MKEAELIEIVRKRICRQAAMVANLKELIKLHKKMVIDRSSWTVLKARKDRQLISEILVYDTPLYNLYKQLH